MDPEDVKKLSGTLALTSAHVGEYKYGFVNWYKPIKITAEVDVNTDVVYTKDAPVETVVLGGDGVTGNVSYASNITTGPAEEAIVVHNNGGSWFKFAAPLTITDADISARTDFKLRLTFNPGGLINASSGVGGQIRGAVGTYSDTTDFHLDVPMLDLTPVVHRGDDTIIRETYYIHPASASNPHKIRVELYTLKSDEVRSVYGVSIAALLDGENSTGTPPGAAKAFYVEETADELILKDWELNPIYSGFKRLTEVGEAPTELTVKSAGLGGDAETTATYELVAIDELE